MFTVHVNHEALIFFYVNQTSQENNSLKKNVADKTVVTIGISYIIYIDMSNLKCFFKPTVAVVLFKPPKASH